MCKIPVYLPMEEASQDSSPQSVAEVILLAYCVKTEGYQTPALSTECSSQLPAPRYLVNGKTGKDRAQNMFTHWRKHQGLCWE